MRALSFDRIFCKVTNSDALASAILELAIRLLAVLLDPEASSSALTLAGQLPSAVYEWCQAAQFIPPGPRGLLSPDVPKVTYTARVMQLLERVLAIAPHGSSDRTRADRLAEALRKIG